MAVTYGFYNALGHDRLYDAIEMSSIFDGIIRDGIFSTIGDHMIVTAPEDGLYVNVGAGRAWFNHTWTLNDTAYPIEAEEAEVVLDRIDAVVLEVNSSPEVRANTIKFIKGTPSSEPVKPTLTHNAEVNQYALAYVTIRAGQTTIFQQDIENAVGTDETPFVTGILQQISAEELILQWENEFRIHFSNWEATNEAEYQTWTTDMQAQYTAWMTAKMNEYATWFSQMQDDMDDDFAIFDAWFQHMKDQLDSDAAGHLQAEIDALALSAEKGSVVTITTINASLFGKTCSISQGGLSRTATFDNSGVAVFESIPWVGTVSVSATDGTQTAVGFINIPYFGRYSLAIAFWAAPITITTTSEEFYGASISVSKNGSLVDTITFDNTGEAHYTATSTGTYKFTVNYEGTDFDSTVEVTEETSYSTVLNAWTAILDINTTLSTLFGRTITIKKGTTTVGTTAFSNAGHATYSVHTTGTYSVFTTDSGGGEYSASVEVIAETTYSIDLGTPNGATVLPTDSIPTWLACAEESANYTTLAEVLADTELFARLCADSNACDYMARSTTWALQSGLVPVMTSATTPEGVVSSKDVYPGGYDGYKAFDGNSSTYYVPSEGTDTKWLQYQSVNPFCVNKIIISFTNNVTQIRERIDRFELLGSNDGSTWSEPIATLSTDDINSTNIEWIIGGNTTSYSYHRINEVKNNSYGIGYYTVQFYTDVDITTNSTAMQIVGKYDYCAEALLSDSTWAEAIGNSEYFESVLNTKVPKMTSNTAPEGQVFASSSVSNYITPGIYIFFNNGGGNNTAWVGSKADVWVGYKFTEKVKVNKIAGWIQISSYSPSATVKFQGSNDSQEWTDIKVWDSWSALGTVSDTILNFDQSFANDAEYTYYRIWADDYPEYTSGSGRAWRNGCWNFFGRTKDVEYTPLVPTMTSNTTPSGVCSGDSSYDSRFDYYKAFAADDYIASGESQYICGWNPSNGSSNQKVYYHSPNPIKPIRFGISRKLQSNYTTTVDVIASNDGTNWTTLISNFTFAGNGRVNNMENFSETYSFADINTDNEYSYLGILVKSTTAPNGIASGAGYKVRFYGPSTGGITIHSAANDTIYYLDGSTPVTVAVTDANGKAIIDTEDLDPGTYTLYSTVAKNPDNLSNPYTKTVKINGNTTEIYLMPVLVLCWFGYEDSRNLPTAVASGNNDGTYNTPPTLTRATNYLEISQPWINSNGCRGCTVYNTQIHDANKINIIGEAAWNGNTAQPAYDYEHVSLAMSNTNNVLNPNDAEHFFNFVRGQQSISITKKDIVFIDTIYFYIETMAWQHNCVFKLYALWYE